MTVPGTRLASGGSSFSDSSGQGREDVVHDERLFRLTKSINADLFFILRQCILIDNKVIRENDDVTMKHDDHDDKNE